MTLNPIWFVFPIVGVLGTVLAYYLAVLTLRHEPGPPEVVRFSAIIQKGAATFLRRQYRAMLVPGMLFAGFLLVALNVYLMLTFVMGVVTSVLAGYVGMRIATQANGRTTFAARLGPNHALDVAFTGGAVLGMAAVSLGVFGISSVYLIFASIGALPDPLTVLTGYSLGASFAAIFARIGGGIFTKAADVGADMVGKMEVGIPEDDPRNAAVIADNVGDNVGDVAGMGADTYQAYVDTTIASLLLGATATTAVGARFGEKALIFPLAVMVAGIVGSVLGIVTVKFLARTEKVPPETLLRLGMVSSGGFTVIGILGLAVVYLGDIRYVLSSPRQRA